MNIHLIAIGGSAMHNLALALHHQGHTVSGSDDEIFEPSRSRLSKAGLLPTEIGWDAQRIHEGLDMVVLGMHAREDNPELIAARQKNLKIVSYPEFIYEISKNKTRVVIGGSHGKTSITSMVLHVCHYTGLEIDYLVGAQLEGFERMVHITKENEFILIEGDEYLSSPIDRRPKFHLYRPNIALLSGIAWDHINVFPSFENYLEQFELFLETIEPGGALVYFSPDENLRSIVEEKNHFFKKFPYETPDWQLTDDHVVIDFPEFQVPVKVFGAHNVANIEGARLICNQLGIQNEDFYEAITSFEGAQKRLEVIYENEDNIVFLDFAHAPSKVKATAEALKSRYTHKKVYAVLELHTFSSLNPDFLPQYAGTLDAVDCAWVFYNPEAVAHKKLPPLSASDVQEAFKRDVRVFTKSELLFADIQHTVEESQEPTALVLMSSGNFANYPVREFEL
ncbi:MAG: peptidoglycan synthetase [Flavobacteriales bacterium]|nr:MAG: peptidoglycan synthetase [Flavobacteriales bacterium]